jgi:molecular chaperone DnaK (HSP70)
MPSVLDASTAKHIVGIDLGTTNVRVHVAHYSDTGQANGEPLLVHLPGSERDGALPSILEMDNQGHLQSFGLPALLNMPRGIPEHFVSEFKPCIGQSSDDLHAQGRPERARFCSNPKCLHPGWAWSVAMRYCGFCGGTLQSASAAGDSWQPTFRYTRDQALNYAGMLLTQIKNRLETQFDEPIKRESGWLIAAGVPVHWQQETLDAYQNVLQEAFPDAGVSLVHEPTGALRYYGLRDMLKQDNWGRQGWTLVVDFGGGTTDLVLAQVGMKNGSLEVGEVKPYGERYGGTDFDLVLAHYAAGEIGIALDGGLLTQWKQQAKVWKEAFSARIEQDAQMKPILPGFGSQGADPEVTVSFPVPKESGLFEYAPVTLKRSVFMRAAGDLVERFRSVLERGLHHFGVEPNEIDQVVLTGGGAHWYFVHETVAEYLPLAKVLASIEPEMSISKGLSLAAAQRTRPAEEAASSAEPEDVEEIATVLSLTAEQAFRGGSYPLNLGDRTITVPVKSYAYKGQTILLPGEGPPKDPGGHPTDLIITLEITALPPEDGDDLYMDLVITPEEAELGGSKWLRVRELPLSIDFPAGTMDGAQLTIPEAGNPGRYGGKDGALHVTARVTDSPLNMLATEAVAATPESQAGGGFGNYPPSNNPPPGPPPSSGQPLVPPAAQPAPQGGSPLSRRAVLAAGIGIPVAAALGFGYHFFMGSAAPKAVTPVTTTPPNTLEVPNPVTPPPMSTVVSVEVCKETHLLPTVYCPHTVIEQFMPDAVPKTHCTKHIGPTCPICDTVYAKGMKFCAKHYPAVKLTGT